MKAVLYVLALSLALISGAQAGGRVPAGYGPLINGVRTGPDNCDKAIIPGGSRWCRNSDVPADFGKNSLKMTDWSPTGGGSGGDGGSGN